MRRYRVASTSFAVMSRLSFSLSSTGVCWVAAGEPAQLDDALGVDGLAKGDAGAVLVDPDPQVEGEKAQVAHLEGRLHLLLE